jgi:hypothetical protein
MYASEADAAVTVFFVFAFDEEPEWSDSGEDRTLYRTRRSAAHTFFT